MRTLETAEEEAYATLAAITKEQKDIISKLSTGDKVYFENIEAKGPDGNIRELGTLCFKIK